MSHYYGFFRSPSRLETCPVSLKITQDRKLRKSILETFQEVWRNLFIADCADDPLGSLKRCLLQFLDENKSHSVYKQAIIAHF